MAAAHSSGVHPLVFDMVIALLRITPDWCGVEKGFRVVN